MMGKTHIQEALCRAYVQAIAGKAGVNASISNEREFDYGIDGTFNDVTTRTLSSGQERRFESGFKWDFQLKCTVDWMIENDDLVYDVEARTYNDLAHRASTPGTLPALLIVLCLPKDEALWLTLDEEQLILRKCGYWFRVNEPPTDNMQSKRIRIPRKQLFTPDALNTLFQIQRQEAL